MTRTWERFEILFVFLLLILAFWAGMWIGVQATRVDFEIESQPEVLYQT